jgi:hypothetical protein
MVTVDSDLPGAELVGPGLQDLAAGRRTVEALVVSVAPERLRELGYSVDRPLVDPELELWRMLAREDPDSAHGRVNALLRRLDSFLRAAAACAS